MNPDPANRFRPRLEVLEDRQLLAVRVGFAAGVLTLAGTGPTNTISLSNNGSGHIGVVTDKGAFSFFDVTAVDVVGNKGGRIVLSWAQQPDALGSGDQVRPLAVVHGDFFDLDFAANLNGHAVKAPLTFALLGGPNHDTFSFNAAGVNLAAGGALVVKLGGGPGTEDVSMLYDGVKSKRASLLFQALGGDSGGNRIHLTGFVRQDPAEDNLTAGPGSLDNSFRILGGGPPGGGNRLRLVLDSELPADGLVDGGTGGEVVAAVTPNVTVTNCQQVVPPFVDLPLSRLSRKALPRVGVNQ